MTDPAPLNQRTLVRITSAPIVVDEALAFVADPGAGGTTVFIGTVRDHSGAGDVTGCGEMHERWPVRRVAIVHRTGDLAVGEASVVVAASAPHRGDAFDACRHGIERLKEDVPIWKKESLVTGDAHWVMGS